MQKSGSFKARGAFNAQLSLTEEQREKGVITFSSGNHALGTTDFNVNTSILLLLADLAKSRT